jgi:hypothetical protein
MCFSLPVQQMVVAMVDCLGVWIASFNGVARSDGGDDGGGGSRSHGGVQGRNTEILIGLVALLHNFSGLVLFRARFFGSQGGSIACPGVRGFHN